MQIYPTIVGLSGVRNPKINPTAGIVFITTATWTQADLYCITQADGSHVGRIFSGIYPSVCFSALYLKNRCKKAAKITKLDTEVTHNES